MARVVLVGMLRVFCFVFQPAHLTPLWIIVSSDSSTQYQNHLKIEGTNEQPRCVFVCVKIQPQRSYSILWVCLNVIVPAPSRRLWFGLLCLFFVLPTSGVGGWRCLHRCFDLAGTCSFARAAFPGPSVWTGPWWPSRLSYCRLPPPSHTPRLLTSVLRRGRQSHSQYSISCAFWALSLVLYIYIYLFIFI